MQRGGNPTCRDCVYATMMGAYAVELLNEGKTNRVVVYREGNFGDIDIDEALMMQKELPDCLVRLTKAMSL